jgi:hypothetical protein
MSAGVIMRNRIYIIMTAVALGILGYFLSGAMFLFLVFGLICFAIYRNSAAEDRKFVVGVLIAGFTVRVVLAVALHAYFYMKGFHSISGDDLLYATRAWALVYEWYGKSCIWAQEIISTTRGYGVNTFTYLLAGFFRIFGYHPVTAKIINCIFGTLIGWFAYLIGKEMFGSRPARIAMCITVFYPSLIRWSVANLKDPMASVIFLTCVYVLTKYLCRKVTVLDLAVFLIAIVLQSLFVQIFYFFLLVFAAVLAVMLKAFSLIGRRPLRIAAAVLIVAGILAGIHHLFSARQDQLISFFYLCEEKQSAMTRVDRAGYALYPRYFMESLNNGAVGIIEILTVLSRSIAYFIFAPFPWAISSIGQLMAFPQVFLWYAILVLSIFGFAKLIISNPYSAVLTGAIITLGIVVISLLEGNVGAAFRHRDIFAPLFIVFASSVIYDLKTSVRPDP